MQLQQILLLSLLALDQTTAFSTVFSTTRLSSSSFQIMASTTSNQEVLNIDASSRPKPYDIAGFNISPLATKEQTQGHEIFHQDGTKGKGPGQHFHSWDESFFVTKGTVHYGTKKQDDIIEDNSTLERIAHVGDFVHIPANTVHWYYFGEEGGEIVSVTASGGHANEMYSDFDKYGSWENPDKTELTKLAAKHGQIVHNK